MLLPHTFPKVSYLEKDAIAHSSAIISKFVQHIINMSQCMLGLLFASVKVICIKFI